MRKRLLATLLILSCISVTGCSTKNKEITLEYNGKQYVGVYTGETSKGVPDGDGKFMSTSGTGNNYLIYEGTFVDGAIEGNGTIECSDYTLLVDEEQFQKNGLYKGDLVDACACGEGTFEATNCEGDHYIYTGEFADNTFEGNGEIKFDSGIDKKGNFTKGAFAPNDILEAFTAYVTFQEPRVSLTDDELDFIESNSDLFYENYDYEKADEMINDELTYEKYSMDESSFSPSVVFWDNYRVVQTWYDYMCTDDYRVNCIIAENVYTYDIVYLMQIQDLNICETDSDYAIKEDTEIGFYGMPIGNSFYTNNGGGKTNCIVVLSSWIGYYD